MPNVRMRRIQRLCVAVAAVAISGCSSIRLDEARTNGYRVDASKQERNEFELSIHLATPVPPSAKTLLQLNELWESEARARCGTAIQGEPLELWQLKEVAGTRNAVNKKGETTLSN